MPNEIGALPDNTVALMVIKQYVDRVKDYLLLPLDYQIPWKVLSHPNNNEEDSSQKNEAATDGESRPVDDASSSNSIIIDTTETSGMSHDRRGYQIMCCKGTTRPIQNLSPLARQNIAWAMKLTHYCHMDGNKMEEAAKCIIENLPIKDIPLTTTDNPNNKNAVRVDVYPKCYTEEICLCLQRAFHAQGISQSTTEVPVPDHPFEGPIAMTLSASKCSHRLAIMVSTVSLMVGDNANVNQSATYVYWGWMVRETDSHMMDLKLNELATNQLQIVASDTVTGKEVDLNTSIPDDTPLSRAYYKLDQVWDDVMEQDKMKSILSKLKDLQASAVDFGSAPGGWTQVLAKRGGGDCFKSICSVDKGALGERIAKHPLVHCIPTLIEDCPATVAPFGPFGFVVCDASLLWNEIMDLFLKVVKGSGDSDNHHSSLLKFTLPCILVITLKLPFQTLQSIQRHIQSIHQRLPTFVSEMAAAMFSHPQPVQSRHTVVHLMANSSSERTLILVFEEKET